MHDLIEALHKNLFINQKYCSKTNIPQIIECFSCGQWLRSIRRENVYTLPPLHSYLTPEEVQSALQLGESIGETWQKILIQILPKQYHNVFTLPKLGNEARPNVLNQMSYFQILQYVSESNIKLLWEDSYQTFENHAVIKQWKDGQKFSLKPHSIVLKNALRRLYKCPIIPISENIDFEEDEENYIHKDGGSLNIHPALFIIEGDDHYFVFMKPSSFSVWDCVNFSPAKLKDNAYGALFILHQLLEGMQVIEECGLFAGNISLHHLRLGADFLLTIIPQITDSLLEPIDDYNDTIRLSECKSLLEGNNTGNEMLHSTPNLNEKSFLSYLSCSDARNAIQQIDPEGHKVSLLQLTQKWVVHEISNFDYLLCLSFFAGHSFQSLANYPILPWVTDFTSHNGGWRDLTKTKYRLNKGDQQLIHTYELAENDSPVDQIAHHIPEFFSEVTYYVYKARVTPKIILKKQVRQQFVPSHYPSSIARMYALTPEECIPEFYCDPSVFKSIHEDLPDLEIPSWCDGLEDFLRMHRAALESNYVSRRLHHWIDLYYGYKLTGSASVKAKNVCLPLVDDHSTLSKGGIVQLFNIPHPPKLTPSPFLSKLPPLPHLADSRVSSKQSKKCTDSIDDMDNVFKDEESINSKDHSHSKSSKTSIAEDKSASLKRIDLPINYNPLTSLNQVEMLYNFFLKTSGKLPDRLNKDDTNSSYSFTEAAQRRRVKDIQILGCLIVQIFSAPRNRILSSRSNFEEIYSLALKILQEPNDIPNCLHNALKLIFQINDSKSKLNGIPIPSKFNAVSDMGLPPPSCNQMLQPLIKTINFPIAFSFLSSFVKNMKSYSNVLEDYYFAPDKNKKDEYIKNVTEKLIKRTASDLRDIVLFLSFDGLKLILPYIIDLYSNPLSAVCSAWYFTDIITQALGPTESTKFILPLLIKLFEVESVNKNHLKLFHKAFLLQLMIRFRLKTFLKHFVTPIIEGAGGYKALMEGSGVSPFGILRKKSKSLRNPRTGFGMEDPKQALPDEENLQSKSESVEQAKQFNRRSSSIRSPSGVENDITDAENDTEIFIFEGGEDEDTLNDFGGNTAMDMNDSLKSPISDTISLEEESLQEGGGSIPSLCPSPHSPTLSGGELEDQIINDDLACGTHISNTTDPTSGIPIPQAKFFESFSKTHEYSSSLPDKPLDSRMPYSVKESRAEAKPFNDIQTVLRTNSIKDKFKDHDSNVSVAEICCENIMWLSHRLGPVLTAKHITRNLLRMLSLCFLPESGSLANVSSKFDDFSVTGKEIAGDNNASKILFCLMEIADLYGEQVILLQYLSHITELVSWCTNKLSTSQEAGLIGAMTLLQHLLLRLSDVTFMECLQETLIRNAVYPVIRLLSSHKVCLPNGVAVRSILAWRVIDSLCVMIRRVGAEMSKEKLMPAITRFLTAFDKVYTSKRQTTSDGQRGGEESNDSESKQKTRDTSSEQEKALEELKNVFTPELAYLSYIPLCKYLGTKYMEDSLPNHDLLRSLCLQYDESKQADFAADLTLDGQSSLEQMQDQDTSFTTNVAVTGNRIDIKDPSDDLFGRKNEKAGLDPPNYDFIISKRFENKEESVRHLRGNWLAYWEHEIGRREQEESFVFNQIKLQTFVGHSNSVKSLYIMDNENSFISCSKDKTVKLWSLRSQGDGNAESGPQWTYSNHKKSVFDVVFCESLRLAASCDSTVHIWDPFSGTCLKQLDSLKHSPVTVLTSMSTPSKQLITATTDSTLKFIDLRTCAYTHELKITTSSVGLVRCMATSGDSHLVAVAHSSGVIATLDLRTGHILATWKPHEGEVLTLQWYEKGTFISSALDQTICVWSVYDNKLKFLLKGPSEPVHLLKTFGNEVLTGTTANRVGLHTSVSPSASFSCTRLRTDAFKGVLTAMGTLPLNRQLLLGADNGTIKLLC